MEQIAYKYDKYTYEFEISLFHSLENTVQAKKRGGNFCFKVRFITKLISVVIPLSKIINIFPSFQNFQYSSYSGCYSLKFS